MTSGKLYGNTASTHSADVYCNKLTTLTLPDAASMGGSLEGEAIVGWYWDGSDPYDWHNGHITKYTSIVNRNAAFCLIAAYGSNAAKIGKTEYKTLQDAITAAKDGETVVLLKDVTENVTATNKTIILDLNGHKVDGDSKDTVLTINGGNVTLTGDGTITGGAGYNGQQGGGVYIKGKANVVLESGTITGNHVVQQGGGVFIDEGTFTMSGGTITGNTAGYSGGGVFV